MKIRTKLHLNAIIALIAAVLVLIPLVWSYLGMMQGNRMTRLAEELRKIALERALILDGYLLKGEERADVRWAAESGRFREQMQIVRAQLDSARELALLDDLDSVFEDTVAMFPHPQSSIPLPEGAVRRDDMPGQRERVLLLKQRDRALITGIDRLEEEIDAAADKARDRTILLLVLFIAMGFTVTVGNSSLINRLLTRRLGELRKGAELIGSGNLDHRLDMRGDDEFAELAQLINQMAANLKGTFISVENLEKEIQERKKVEEEREQYFKFFQASEDLMCIADPDGSFKRVNPACVQLLGYTEAELLSRPFVEFVHPDDRQATLDETARQIRSGYTLNFENRYLCKDGGVRWILWSANYLENEGVTYATGRDISERKRVEESLLKLSIAVEQSPVSIVITDASGNIEFVNPKFTQLTGYEASELIGRNPRILKSGETPPETYRRLWDAITSGRIWQGLFHNRKKNGEIFIEAATIAPVKNRQGVITNYIAIKEDVTERRSLENQLRQSQKMEAIGTLAGGVAHDFNNILTAIIGFGSLLEMKLDRDDPQHYNLSQILAAADRAVTLTRSLLAFSRMQQLETRVLDLNDIVTGVEKMLRRLIREDIELTISTASGAIPVQVGTGQIEQVLVNLVTNARDSMPDGGRLSISTACTTMDEEFSHLHGYGAPGEYALLTVADSGVGMEESVRQRIFDPFFTTKEVGKGTGLGLSVCYGIVKQHGGYINCYSEPGSGTTFRIYLPLVTGEAKRVEAGTVIPIVGGTETILLAEDDPNVRQLIRSILREFGYSVIEAVDGEQAVNRFMAHGAGIDLCIFDVIMPKKKGWEAYGEIVASRPDARVLYMSGYQADFDRLTDLTKNGTGFIAKPINPRDLLLKVREMLGEGTH